MMKTMYQTVVFVLLFCSIPFSSLQATVSPISFEVQMLPWKEVNKIIPNKSIFTVVDVDTGLQFKVQRRAGKRHADVQPLTRADTKIMKTIYNGKWSWQRRAILVLMNDQMIAASMHGMPHGAGALPNGFPGHFCIHFAGSTTHRSGKADLSHKVMILKAAGKLDDYLERANPYEIVHIFSATVNQGDEGVLRMLLAENEYVEPLIDAASNIEALSIKGVPVSFNDADGLLQLTITAKATMYIKEKGKQKRTITFIVQRSGMEERWRIEPQSVLDSL